MKKVSKKRNIYIIVCLFLCVSSIFGIYVLLKDNNTFIKNYPFTIETSEIGYTEEPYFYTTLNGQNVYSYLKSIKIKTTNSSIELEDYLKENPNALEEMMNHMELIDIYQDGGTQLYRDKGGSDKSFTTDGLAIIKCNKMQDVSSENNNDIYIGKYDLEYTDGICENVRMVMVDNHLYYDTRKESEQSWTCGTGAENITSSVKENEIPTKNDESNFGTNYQFMRGENNTIEIFLDGKWTIFETRYSRKLPLINEDTPKDSIERIVKIDGELYYEVKNQFHFWCEESNNKIESVINSFEIPTENNQANFDGESYTFVYKKDIVRVCNPATEESVFLKRKNIIKENPKLVVNQDGTIDIDSEFIQNLYFRVNPSNDSLVVSEMFKDTNKLSDKYIIATALMNLILEKELLNEEYIDQKDVEDMVLKIFGNIKFTHQDAYVCGTDIYQNGLCGYWYREESKQYELMHGCGGAESSAFRRKIISAYQEDDYIYIKEKSIYAYFEVSTNDISKKYIYNNVNKENLIDYIEKPVSESYPINLENYFDKASTYIYIFKKNNDDYILEKIIRK